MDITPKKLTYDGLDYIIEGSAVEELRSLYAGGIHSAILFTFTPIGTSDQVSIALSPGVPVMISAATID